jgi:predicted site-specific integrase-resolvase
MRRKWLGLSEAALVAAINRERLLRLVQSGVIAGRRNVTGRWEVSRPSLQSYLDERRTPSQSAVTNERLSSSSQGRRTQC